MKIWKKNLIAAAVLVTVCAGIYVNWVYAGKEASAQLSDVVDEEKLLAASVEEPEVLSDGTTTAANYFAAVRLSRQQARDSAVNLLQEAMAYSEGSKAAESAADLDDIVQTALSEAQIESLIIAKGYADCVAYMSADGISVAVAAPEGGLTESDVAVIADLGMSQSGYTMSGIRVVEVQ